MLFFLHPSATTGNRHYRMTFDLRELPTRYDNGGGSVHKCSRISQLLKQSVICSKILLVRLVANICYTTANPL